MNVYRKKDLFFFFLIELRTKKKKKEEQDEGIRKHCEFPPFYHWDRWWRGGVTLMRYFHPSGASYMMWFPFKVYLLLFFYLILTVEQTTKECFHCYTMPLFDSNNNKERKRLCFLMTHFSHSSWISCNNQSCHSFETTTTTPIQHVEYK